MFVFDQGLAADFGIPISIVDGNGFRCLVSERFADAVRRSSDELIGVPWHAICHVDDVADGKHMARQVLENDAPVSVRRRLLCGDGGVIEAVLHGRRCPHPKGRGHVIQTNMSVSTLAAAPIVGDFGPTSSDPQALLGVIRDGAALLSQAAGANDMRLLQHLLAMASAEAGIEFERRVSRMIPQQNALAKRMH